MKNLKCDSGFIVSSEFFCSFDHHRIYNVFLYKTGRQPLGLVAVGRGGGGE